MPRDAGALCGIINLDKPAGMSSAGAVAAVKRLLARGTKVGHAGTLDPFATGVLVLLVGRATRLFARFMSHPKQYEATIKLGATTQTLDPTSPEIATPGAGPVPVEAIAAVLPAFIGEIRQVPPAYSALWIDGRRAYDLARSGRAVTPQARTVQVYGIEMLSYDWPLLRLRIDCGKGTYIRSLARDIGSALGMGGYLTALRRTRVGPCRIEDAVSLDQLSAGAQRHILPAT